MKPILAILALLAGPAHAEGFALTDLSGLPTDGTLVGGGSYIGRAEPARLTLMCPDCPGAPVVDAQLGRQDDGTEDRVRTGETTFAKLEELCQARDPACRLEGLEVAPAVGWMTTYALGSRSAHTVVILRDGDLLTLRIMSDDPAVARSTAETLIGTLVPQVVGE
ncbi:hypothetical protein [Tabrizicola sp.]|uniref:hypothetical protein n=1 Tax=Tabrizicola sp. TaxID=2005166 RepID=UPI003F2A1940